VDPREQGDPEPLRDPRRHRHDPTKPEADSLEQELPLEGGAEAVVPDPERVEPLDMLDDYDERQLGEINDGQP